ncbi:uncharacterized protein BDZ99DRAFT_523959 [Mytilinidion resinicola]|uniref:Uncharacterized protein n=1 Tax=Mytilinidion resinicola TaxID=574789 RepID=A0A6A6YCI3_9PEZI|nr:uncharacterized protein BDZ99DRAFT_523959 [Mytilinidion resinicola]KAF2806521.1 hypothetical protein BDZ99DRAFT_523959 [Mytilinidion resinicola]
MHRRTPLLRFQLLHLCPTLLTARQIFPFPHVAVAPPRLKILGACLGTIVLLTVCILLSVYDGRSQPSIRWGITLNAVLALLTTIMKAALLIIVAEGLNQEKWARFANRPLWKYPLSDSQTLTMRAWVDLGACLCEVGEGE